MDFGRSRIGAPVPKVLAWDASSDNNVGCEYIIMKKCESNMLANVLDSSSDSYHIFDITSLLSDLAAIPFSQCGSIYYKEDVDPLLQTRPLYAKGEQHDDCSERFRIGPSVERRFYRGKRSLMLIDRGPCEISLWCGSALIDMSFRDGHLFLHQGCCGLRNQMDPVVFKHPKRSKSDWCSTQRISTYSVT